MLAHKQKRLKVQNEMADNKKEKTYKGIAKIPDFEFIKEKNKVNKKLKKIMPKKKPVIEIDEK